MDAILCCLFLEAGLSALDTRLPYIDARPVVTERYGVRETFITPQIVDRAANPYGHVAIGWEREFSVRFLGKVTSSLEVSHDSSIATGIDRGVNAVSVNVRVFPFRGAR